MIEVHTFLNLSFFQYLVNSVTNHLLCPYWPEESEKQVVQGERSGLEHSNCSLDFFLPEIWKKRLLMRLLGHLELVNVIENRKLYFYVHRHQHFLG